MQVTTILIANSTYAVVRSRWVSIDKTVLYIQIIPMALSPLTLSDLSDVTMACNHQ